MELTVVTFAGRHVRSAAALLAATHAAGRGVLQVSDEAVAIERIAAWTGHATAVAAERDGRLVGFVAATVDGAGADRRARTRIDQHAASSEDGRIVYRRLYAALSGRLVAAGAVTHDLTVSTERADSGRVWSELGFGVDQIKGIRSVSPAPSAAAIPVRPAGPDDLADCERLARELVDFHAQAPMLQVPPADLTPVNEGFRRALQQPRETVLVAEHEGRVGGVMQVGPDRAYRDTATIGLAAVTAPARSAGLGTALVGGVLDWAARNDFSAAAVEWTSANLVSDPFWRRRGFAPVHEKLTRRLDPRIV